MPHSARQASPARRPKRVQWRAALLLLSCSACSSVRPLPTGGIHVLFIGNSLTYANDLPGTVTGLAESVGDTIRVQSVALPNVAVIDHALGLNGSDAIARVKSQRWDVVLLQQGPTPAGLERDTLILAAQTFDPLVRAAGGRIGALMTWPSLTQQKSYPLLFDQTRETCLEEARAVRGTCFAAGEAWRAAWAADPTLALYSADSYHPSPIGTYLTALVVYEELTSHDARKLPGAAVVEGKRLDLPETTVRMLQGAAHSAVTLWSH